MKKALFLLATLALVAGCSSPEKEAQKLITGHLQKTLNDWSSYEPIEFSNLDSAFTSVQENERYAIAYHRYDSFLKSAERITEKIILASNRREILSYKYQAELDLNMARNYYDLAQRIDSLFVPEFKGWSMIHTYRVNNVLGTKIIAKEKYTFDPEMTKITKTEKMKGI